MKEKLFHVTSDFLSHGRIPFPIRLAWFSFAKEKRKANRIRKGKSVANVQTK